MPRGKSYEKTEKETPEPNIAELIRRVPRHVFVQMVTKSGLTSPEQRLLCKRHKELQS